MKNIKAKLEDVTLLAFGLIVMVWSGAESYKALDYAIAPVVMFLLVFMLGFNFAYIATKELIKDMKAKE
mgnify:CR=1 FL=1